MKEVYRENDIIIEKNRLYQDVIFFLLDRLRASDAKKHIETVEHAEKMLEGK
jgi:hypothetical protein